MIERAVLLDFDSGSYSARVRFRSSLAGTVASVPVSRAIASGDLIAGRVVAVAIFDPSNHLDAMVVGVH